MIKKIRLGLSAGIAFALMFATSAGVVAQEKVAATDNVEVKASPINIGSKQLTKNQWYGAALVNGQWSIGAQRNQPTAGTGIGCFLGNDGEYCAILLTMHNSISEENLEGKTLQEIQTLYGDDPATGGVENAEEYGREEESSSK